MFCLVKQVKLNKNQQKHNRFLAALLSPLGPTWLQEDQDEDKAIQPSQADAGAVGQGTDQCFGGKTQIDSLQIFKKGVRPMWEDVANANGGASPIVTLRLPVPPMSLRFPLASVQTVVCRPARTSCLCA